MQRAAFALFLLLAGCGSTEVPVDNQVANEAEIQRLSTPKQIVVDTEAPARTQPLVGGDLVQAGMVPPLCDFNRGGQLLLAVSQADAIARVAGTLHHFAHASPAGPTGGFFEDRMVSISVGRTGAIVPHEGATGRWPGRLTVTNRRAHAQVEMEGVWRCGS